MIIVVIAIACVGAIIAGWTIAASLWGLREVRRMRLEFDLWKAARPELRNRKGKR